MRAKPITILGVTYPSQTAAATALGLTRQSINQRAKAGCPNADGARGRPRSPLPKNGTECVPEKS